LIDAIPLFFIIVITRSVLFSIKCTRNRPDPLGSLSAPPDPLAVLGGWGPRKEGKGKGSRRGRERKGENKGKGVCERERKEGGRKS